MKGKIAGFFFDHWSLIGYAIAAVAYLAFMAITGFN